MPTDVSKKSEVDQLVTTVNQTLGKIDILVNNAANGGSGPSLLDSDEQRWDEIIDTNLKSVYLCCHAVGPTMIERGSGSILNISSIASLRASEGARIYGIAKAGMNFLTRGLAVDLAPHNIRVNCIAPGAVQTDMLAADVGDTPESWEQLGNFIPLGRVGQPIDIAATALFWFQTPRTMSHRNSSRSTLDLPRNVMVFAQILLSTSPRLPLEPETAGF